MGRGTPHHLCLLTIKLQPVRLCESIIFRGDMSRKSFHISAPVTLALIFDLLTSKNDLPVTPDVGNLPCKFERCTLLRFQVHGGHGTDGQTGERCVARNAAFYGGPHKNVKASYSYILEDCGYTRTRGFTRPDPYPRVRVGSGTCSTGTGWVG